MIIKKIEHLDYILLMNEFRTGLTDFYIYTQQGSCRMAGAFEENDKPVGLLIFEQGEYDIRILYISSQKSTKEVICQILRWLEKKAKDEGIKKISYMLLENNQKERELVEKEGYVVQQRQIVCECKRSGFDKWHIYLQQHGNALIQLLLNENFKVLSFDQCNEDMVRQIFDSSKLGFSDDLYPEQILSGYHGTFCENLSFVALKDQEVIAYCLVTTPDHDHLIYDIISSKDGYTRTGVIFLPFAYSVNAAERSDYTSIRFTMIEDNRKAIALSKRMMKSLISKQSIIFKYVKEINLE